MRDSLTLASLLAAFLFLPARFSPFVATDKHLSSAAVFPCARGTRTYPLLPNIIGPIFFKKALVYRGSIFERGFGGSGGPEKWGLIVAPGRVTTRK